MRPFRGFRTLLSVAQACFVLASCSYAKTADVPAFSPDGRSVVLTAATKLPGRGCSSSAAGSLRYSSVPRSPSLRTARSSSSTRYSPPFPVRPLSSSAKASPPGAAPRRFRSWAWLRRKVDDPVPLPRWGGRSDAFRIEARVASRKPPVRRRARAGVIPPAFATHPHPGVRLFQEGAAVSDALRLSGASGSGVVFPWSPAGGVPAVRTVSVRLSPGAAPASSRRQADTGILALQEVGSRRDRFPGRRAPGRALPLPVRVRVASPRFGGEAAADGLSRRADTGPTPACPCPTAPSAGGILGTRSSAGSAFPRS
jgi:hypothetical protein